MRYLVYMVADAVLYAVGPLPVEAWSLIVYTMIY